MFSMMFWNYVILLRNLPTSKCSKSAISTSLRLKTVNRLMVFIVVNTYAPGIHILICPRTETNKKTPNNPALEVNSTEVLNRVNSYPGTLKIYP